ncbi:hypothetical protein NpPPO83_00004653 [Neofusicoccum parvum]|uniref:Uncharacterized protein n=1 Tax=Neofusicoccum parvum TaxID=310453 RepID=A0ACB5S085_9PEZI|nr:hypothetical protein NpPPO83_00004653 [Neofusicoccum parvum]
MSSANSMPTIDPELTGASAADPFRTVEELEMEQILNSVLQGETQLPDMLDELGNIPHPGDGFPDLWNDFLDFGHPDQIALSIVLLNHGILIEAVND